jgi:hypothetical protein
MKDHDLAYASTGSRSACKRQCRGGACRWRRVSGEIGHPPATRAKDVAPRAAGSTMAFGPIRVKIATLDKPLDANDHSFAPGPKSHPSALTKRFRIQNGLACVGNPGRGPPFEYPDSYFLFLFLILTYLLQSQHRKFEKT